MVSHQTSLLRPIIGLTCMTKKSLTSKRSVQARFSINCSSVHAIVTSRSSLISTWYRQMALMNENPRNDDDVHAGDVTWGAESREGYQAGLFHLQPAFPPGTCISTFLAFPRVFASTRHLHSLSCWFNILHELKRLATKDKRWGRNSKCPPEWRLRGEGCWSLSYQFVPKNLRPQLNWNSHGMMMIGVNGHDDVRMTYSHLKIIRWTDDISGPRPFLLLITESRVALRPRHTIANLALKFVEKVRK